MEDRKVYVELTEKEINSIVFQLQERIEHYHQHWAKEDKKLGIKTKGKTTYLEGIQNKLLECKLKQSKEYYQKKWG